jgi:hypothetical protein
MYSYYTNALFDRHVVVPLNPEKRSSIKTTKDRVRSARARTSDRWGRLGA